MANTNIPAKEIVIQDIIEKRIKYGFSTSSIVKFLQKEYGYGNTYSYLLYNEASKLIGQTFNEMNKNALVDSVMLMENMLQAAIHDNNGKHALEILKELNKCNQLYVQKLEIDSKGEPITINFNNGN
jgi:hypothetical protein